MLAMELEGESPDIFDEEWAYYEDQFKLVMDEMRKYNPPEVTLSALTETGRDESTIPVLKQRSYTGRKVISSALADTPCADLGVHGVFEKLNVILGTSYNLSSTMSSLLESYIENNYDFGMAYAYLRFYWFHSAITDKLLCEKQRDEKMRSQVIADDMITERNMPPRRVWDLYANRVVPYWVGIISWQGISHAWLDVEERVDVMTPINGYEWPVPLPKDADLNLIRVEMLNFGAEYAWLDVLCVRQRDGIREDLRKEEWKLDIPTIGGVYGVRYKDKLDGVVCYLSGLGLPLNIKPGDLESDRCWFRRAWSLQEVPNGSDPLIGGDTGDDRIMDKDMQTTVYERLRSLSQMRLIGMPFNILSQMQERVSMSHLDKFASLVCLFNMKYIPIFDIEGSAEHFWAAVMDAMSRSSRADFFFYYPGPGNGKVFWRPSWDQVMTSILPRDEGQPNVGGVDRTEKIDSDWYEGPRIDSIYVNGLAETSGEPRWGKLSIKDNTGGFCECKIIANHTYPIPDGWYTLIGTGGRRIRSGRTWVVGRQRYGKKFEKVSVISLADDEEVGKLRELGVERCLHTDIC
ncbi:uncharacterized protein EV420DRAFT_1720606 [Desarmillaria tabescens]|uniref:Heterokaryon incompatibility domain-containing protein n=1 Tax=Armillaria tabescens TaxID=1929756 RepID=A0AA39JM57_ARMTA|nr:uncharacterized protein EV420DRAFT_1720606 [Desarmillaria tabescens]KAK0445311.1 hypothetical protein EV420DRAFT_1720606 [Desarmillaria tabescens]